MISHITRKMTLIAAVLTIGQVLAAEPVKIKHTNTRNNLERILDRALSKHLAYPLMEQEDMTGEVFVSFVIDKEGKVELLECASENDKLKDYVIRKLARVDIGDNPNGIWRTTHMRISFRPEHT